MSAARPLLILLALLAGCTAPGPLPWPDPVPTAGTSGAGTPVLLRRGGRSIATGFGWSMDPDAPMVTVDMQYAPLDHFTIGPKVQLAMNDKAFIFAPTLNIKNTFIPPLPLLDNFVGFIQIGAGFVFMDKDRPQGGVDDDDGAFLVNGGAGLEIPFDRDVTLGMGFLINYAPQGVLDEHSFVTWEFLTLRFWF